MHGIGDSPGIDLVLQQVAAHLRQVWSQARHDAKGLPLQDGQPIAVEYDPSGEEIGTIALAPGTEIVSSGEWNAWVLLWTQAIADRDPDSSLWAGRQVTAEVRFSRIEPRLPSSRRFFLVRLGSRRTLHFPIDTVTLRAQARLGNPSSSTGEEPSVGVDGFSAVRVVDLDYAFDVEFTQYSVNPGSTDRTANQGLVKHISAQDLRETDIYIFRAADDKLVGERRGMSPLELSGIAAPSQYPNATVPSGCEGFACLSFVVVTRGPALVDLDQKGPVGDDGVLAPFASDPPGGQPGLEVEYPESPNTVFLRPGDLVRVVAINRATGYTGMELGRVYVDSASAAAQATGQAGVGQHLLTVRSQGLSVIADASDPQQDLRIDMYPPNLRVRVNRQYDVERGATAGEERNYIVGFEGSALNTDDLITVRTEWFAPDGSPLPAGLPGLTGRLARVREGVLQEVGVVDAAETNVGEFPISPGVQVSVAKLPEGGVDKEHLYLHIDGSPSVGTNDFAGRAGISRPDFSVGEVCYFSTGTAEVCFQKQSEDPSLQSRPAQFVPFQVPIYDKDHSEAQRAAFLEQDLEDPGPVYRWPYRPEMQFSVHDLEVEDVYRVEEDGTEVSVIQDDIPILTATNGRIDYTLDGPLDSPLPAFEDIDGDGQPDSRAFGWEFDGRVSDPFLPDTGQQQLLFESLVEEGDGLEADDFMALSLFQLGDEANVLWEFSTLDFRIDPGPGVDVEVPIQRPLGAPVQDASSFGADLVLSARVFLGSQPAQDGAEVLWEFVRNEGGTLTQDVALTERGYATTHLLMAPTAGSTYRVRATLLALQKNGQREELAVPLVLQTGLLTVVPGEANTLEVLPLLRNELIADGTDSMVVTLRAADFFNNPVEDGTPVSARFIGLGDVVPLDPGPDAAEFPTASLTTNGEAQFSVVSGQVPELLPIEFQADAVQQSVGVDVVEVVANLASSSSTIDALAGERATLTATFTTPGGDPVPAGTEVLWLTSEGRLTEVTTTDAFGMATATLDAGPTGNGPAWVRAAVGPFGAQTTVDIVRGAYEVELDPTRPVLAGDVAQDGAMEVERFDGGPDDIIPYYRETTMTVRGPPGTTAVVRAGEPLVPGFLQETPPTDLEFEYVQSDGTLVSGDTVHFEFDGSGEAVITVRVTSRVRTTFYVTDATTDPVTVLHGDQIRHLPFEIGTEDGTTIPADIAVAPSSVIVALTDFARGFWRGAEGGDGYAAHVGNFVSGWLGFADVRDILIAGSQYLYGEDVLFGTEREISGWEVGLSALGLAATALTISTGGIAAPFKAMILDIKSILRLIRDPRQAMRIVRATWDLIREAARLSKLGVDRIAEFVDFWAPYFKKLNTVDPNDIEPLLRVIARTSKQLAQLRRLHAVLDDDVIDVVVGLQRAGVSDEAVEGALRALGGLEREALLAIKSENRLGEAAIAVAQSVRSGVQPEALSKVIDVNESAWNIPVSKIGRPITRTQFLEDFALIVEKARLAGGDLKDAHATLDRVAANRNNAGDMFEVLAIAHAVRQGGDLRAFGRTIKKNGQDVTDFDGEYLDDGLRLLESKMNPIDFSTIERLNDKATKLRRGLETEGTVFADLEDLYPRLWLAVPAGAGDVGSDVEMLVGRVLKVPVKAP